MTESSNKLSHLKKKKNKWKLVWKKYQKLIISAIWILVASETLLLNCSSIIPKVDGTTPDTGLILRCYLYSYSVDPIKIIKTM